MYERGFNTTKNLEISKMNKLDEVLKLIECLNQNINYTLENTSKNSFKLKLLAKNFVNNNNDVKY